VSDEPSIAIVHHNRPSAPTAAGGDSLHACILAAIGHDLRTPLTAITAAATSLLSEAID